MLRTAILSAPTSSKEADRASGGFLFRLPALGAPQLFARQLLVKGLATVDADLAALIFSAHVLDCGEPRLCLAKVTIFY
jgi:hypothetical protein